MFLRNISKTTQDWGKTGHLIYRLACCWRCRPFWRWISSSAMTCTSWPGLTWSSAWWWCSMSLSAVLGKTCLVGTIFTWNLPPCCRNMWCRHSLWKGDEDAGVQWVDDCGSVGVTEVSQADPTSRGSIMHGHSGWTGNLYIFVQQYVKITLWPTEKLLTTSSTAWPVWTVTSQSHLPSTPAVILPPSPVLYPPHPEWAVPSHP